MMNLNGAQMAHMNSQTQMMMMNNPMLMGMQGMQNMGVNNGIFFYRGNVVGLQSRLQDLRNTMTPITEVNITLTGNQIKEHNLCCVTCTIVAGSFLIFPLCFMCCNWYKKIVNPAYQVPLRTYQMMEILFTCPTIRSITLMVCDNTFGLQKSQLFYGYLSRSSTKGFVFNNLATNNDFNQNQYSSFKQHMKPIKQLPIMSDIKWYTQIVL